MIIKAVLIDDMKPALREMEFLLKAYPQIQHEGSFTDPITAIEQIGTIRPEVVFLDIDMPQLQGIDAASEIKNKSPGTEIVFVTAFNQYAVEAFELNAVDYLLKPVDTKRLDQTINRLMAKKVSVVQSSERSLQLQSFGRFQVGWSGQAPIVWRTDKTKELFAYLLHNSKRGISKEEMLEALWTGMNYDRAIKQLYNGVYYIRKALSEYGITREQIEIDSNYSMKFNQVTWDRDVLLQYVENRRLNGELEACLQAEAVYTSNYLEGENYIWSIDESDRLAGMYQECVTVIAVSYMEEGRFDSAEKLLQKAYSKNQCLEGITELLIKLYITTGNKTKAGRHLKSYAENLHKKLDVLPDSRLEKLIKP